MHMVNCLGTICLACMQYTLSIMTVTNRNGYIFVTVTMRNIFSLHKPFTLKIGKKQYKQYNLEVVLSMQGICIDAMYILFLMFDLNGMLYIH